MRLSWIATLAALSCTGKSSPEDSQVSTSPTPTETGDTGTTGVDTAPVDTASTDTATLTCDSDTTVLDTGDSGDTAEDTGVMTSTEGNVGTRVYKILAAGWAHTLALTPEGEIDCWGDCDASNVPPGSYEKVCAEGGYACVLDADGAFVCWYDGGDIEDTVLAGPPNDVVAVDIDCGGGFVCVVGDDEMLSCWGVSDGSEDDYGQVTDAPVSLEDVQSVHTGYYHGCVLDGSGEATCWGSNLGGEIEPTPGTYTTLEGGWNTTCGLDSEGQVVCWGVNYPEYIGYSEGLVFQELSDVNVDSLCGVVDSGELYWWGALGEEKKTAASTGLYMTAACGLHHVCALDEDGYAHCWGNDYYGQSSPP